MSGRPQSIVIDDRFRQMIRDYQKGILPIEVIADTYKDSRGKPLSTKTIRRTIERMDSADHDQKTYAPITDFGKTPGIHDFEVWLQTQTQKVTADRMISNIERIWEEVLQKKNLALLTERDMGEIALWIHNLSTSQTNKFSYMMAIRYLLRYGYGQHGWLTRYLGTKKLKGPPRMPPELKTKETFVQVMPRLYHALDKLQNDGKITTGIYRTTHMVEQIKSCLQARTGDFNAQREVWGTIINNPQNGKSSLILDDQGKIRHWSVFAKKGEMWEIPRRVFEIFPGLCEEIEGFIHDYDIKRGYPLVTADVDEIRRVILRQSQIAELSPYHLHDLRKVSATRCMMAGMRIEETANFGVGWLDIPTLVKYYIAIKGLNMEGAYQTLASFMRSEQL
jgi:hypothetical protein